MSQREELIGRIKNEAQIIINHSVGSIDVEENAKAIALRDDRVIGLLADRLSEGETLKSFAARAKQSPNLFEYELLATFEKRGGGDTLLCEAQPKSHAVITIEIPTRAVKQIR